MLRLSSLEKLYTSPGILSSLVFLRTVTEIFSSLSTLCNISKRSAPSCQLLAPIKRRNISDRNTVIKTAISTNVIPDFSFFSLVFMILIGSYVRHRFFSGIVHYYLRVNPPITVSFNLWIYSCFCSKAFQISSSSNHNCIIST